jgi:hypothetical protein
MHKIKEGYDEYKKRLERSIEGGTAKEVCDLSEVVKNLGKVLLIDDELENGMEHQTSQRSYRSVRSMADRAYGDGSYADGGYSGDDASYRRGRSERTGRYVSRRSYGDNSYGDSDHMSQTIERMMQGKSGEEREVLEKCMDMIDRYA